MFNCFQGSFKGRVAGLFPNNDAAEGYVRAMLDTSMDNHDDYEIKGAMLRQAMITIYVENERRFSFPNNDVGRASAERIFQTLCRLFGSVAMEMP